MVKRNILLFLVICSVLFPSCIQPILRVEISPSTSTKIIPVKVIVKDVMTDKDCLTINFITTQFYSTVGKFKCYEPDLFSFTKQFEAVIKVPLIKKNTQCDKPICFVNTKKMFYAVINEEKFQELVKIIKQYDPSADPSYLSFEVIPKSSRITAFNVYINGKPYITYKGNGWQPLKFSQFMTEYLTYHGWVPLIYWK
jgi:hypothetical protein